MSLAGGAAHQVTYLRHARRPHDRKGAGIVDRAGRFFQGFAHLLGPTGRNLSQCSKPLAQCQRAGKPTRQSQWWSFLLIFATVGLFSTFDASLTSAPWTPTATCCLAC